MTTSCQNKKCGKEISVYLPSNDAQTIEVECPDCKTKQTVEVPAK